MQRFIVLFAFGLASVVAIDKECLNLLYSRTFECCKNHKPPTQKDPKNDIRECFESLRTGPPDPASCKVDICIAKKLGYGSDDGTFDKQALSVHIEEEFKEDEKLLENIKTNCVNGNLTSYGPEQFCDLIKLRQCVHLTALLACPEWDSGPQCSATKDLVMKCN